MQDVSQWREQCEALGHVDELVDLIGPEACTPGWIRRPTPLLWPQKPSVFEPAHWSYARMRPALLAACRLIDTEQAERRNFVLRNPVAGNDFATTRTLVGAYQAILPGEVARTHRHTPHALRVILEARGAYSVVNGVRHPMETGDIVLTPGDHWHGHGHDGDQPALWFDCLDVPLVHLLEPMHVQDDTGDMARILERSEHSDMRLSWAGTQRRLERARQEAPSECMGTTVDLSSPQLPTIAIGVHAWPAGWRSPRWSQRANRIHVVLAGRGRSTVGGCTFEWGFGDVLALPMGHAMVHEALEDATVVSLSDEPLMRWAGYYRMDRHD